MRILIGAVILWFLGRAAAQDLESATRQAEQLVVQQPTAGNWQKLGLARYLQNRFAPASEAFQQAVKLDPKLWTAHLFLGISRYRMNDFGAALATLRQADRLAPKTGPGRDDLDYWLGATHIALRQPLPGLAALEKLLARNPQHADALQLATETYAESASALWNHIAEQSLASSAGQEVHGYALESEGNRTDALQAFQEAIRLAPKRPGPGAAMARLLLQAGDLSAASVAVTRELGLNPVSPEANLYAGLLAVSQGKFGEAVAPLTRASQWMPDNEEPLLALAQVHLSLQQPEQAVAAARRATALEARSLAAHELLMTALSAAKDEAGAAAERLRWQGLR